MQRVGDEFTVIDGNGNGVNAAVVTVYDSVSGTILANVYNAGGSLTTPASKANPFTTDAVGRWSISLPDGRYNFQISGGNIATYTINNVCVFDNTVTYPSPALGTVTSVSVIVPAEMTIGGTPIVSAGAFTFDWATQAKNLIFAGPATGANAKPTFRVAVLADLPSFGPTASTTFGSATKASVVTTNAQGIITTIAELTVTPAFSSLTGLPTTVTGHGITNGVAAIYRSIADVAVSNTTTDTNLLSASLAGTATIAANQLVAGSTIKADLMGYWTHTGASTLKIRLLMGATVLLDTTALVNPTIATITNMPISIQIVYTVRTVGVGGTGMGQMFVISPVVAIATAINTETWPQPAFTATSSIDTTAGGALTVMLQWGTAAVGNTITITNSTITLEG